MAYLLQVSADTRAVTTADLVVITIVVLSTMIVTRFMRPFLRSLLTWLARRSITGEQSRWRPRTPRLFGETIEQAELRRLQRINATAAALSRLFGGVLWVIALVIVLERAEIDPVFAISGAGFLGAAIAFGGQHSVNDFLTGMHILLEDRFGEGDSLRLKVGDDQRVLVVAHLGAFATRFEDDDATYHIPNRELTVVANLSQRGALTEFEFEPTGEVASVPDTAAVESAVRARYARTTGFDGSRDGLVFDSIEDDGDSYTVRIRTARPLSDAQWSALTRRTEHDHDGPVAHDDDRSQARDLGARASESTP